MRSLLAVCALAILLAGCASITAYELDSNGNYKNKDSGGIIYYPPRPYLLVATSPSALATQQKAMHVLGEPAHASTAPNSGTPVPVDSTDTTTFVVAGSNYLFKLIYLPDYSKPRALVVKGGLFGKVSVQPQLQQGWMLTGFQASADASGTTQLVSSLVSSALGAASPKGTNKAELASAGTAASPAEPSGVLTPGLYRIDFASDTGLVTGITPVTFFCRNGSLKAPGAAGDCSVW
jgi:hypothetical protein